MKYNPFNKKIKKNKGLEKQINTTKLPQESLHEALKCPTLHSQEYISYFLNKKYN